MNTLSTMIRVFLFLCLGASALHADGLMRPADAAYPKNFLRTRMTRVDVTLYGQIAVTKVYQEFVNEWDRKTAAVYSFPLPMDARATDFFFWANDTMYQSVLKVKEQATNPGTGEGGIDALLNAYLGKNALRVQVNDIPAGGLQKTQLEYISLCSYDQGRIRYTFPFNTQDFMTTPLESFTFTAHISAAEEIIDASIAGRSGTRTNKTDQRHWELVLDGSKMHATSDIALEYRTSSDAVNVEMYGVSNDTLDGHFVMVVKPRTTLDTSSILPKNVVFLVDRSVNASGTPLTASIAGVKNCLAGLRPNDLFNVLIFNASVGMWRATSQPASASNIASASNYLSGVAASGSAGLTGAIGSALSMFTSDSLNNIVMLFCDGQTFADLRLIGTSNKYKAAIFPVAIGENANRPRLESIAYQNYGIPTFLALTDPLQDRIAGVFAQFNAPVVKDVRMEFGSNVYGLLPRTLQTMYHGSPFFITGRFKKAAVSAFSIAGYTMKGPEIYNYTLNFPSEKSANKFAERFWAKEQIDAIEREIALYTATDSLKQLAIRYSLMYNIRCQYTAYIADKTKPVTSDVEMPEQSIERFTIARSGASSVVLSWGLRVNEAVAACRIYRSDRADGAFVKLTDTPAGATTFTDADAPVSRTYFYMIEIITASGRRLTAVRSGATAAAPAAFALLQNFPNPFNPSTSIRFDVARTSQVTIALYDVLGREIALLVDERMAPGSYARQWNAAGLPSGIYLCRMTAGGRTMVRKMLFTK